MMTIEDVELQAYYLWENRGRPWGTPDIDWFDAEKRITSRVPDAILSKVAAKVGSALGSAVAVIRELDPTNHDQG